MAHTKSSAAPWISVVVISFLAYLPTVNNFFISDDFTLLPFVAELDQNPWMIWDHRSEFFRLVSYVYFWVTFKTFGLNPEPYYWASLALHAGVGILVYVLVRTITKNRLASWTAAVFFAAYARHEEAVMWISANNETIFALSALTFLILWERYIHKPTSANYLFALLVFPVTLFSKEAAVVLLPLAMLRLYVERRSSLEVLRRCGAHAGILGIFILFWLSQASRNFFITDGHYVLGLHFFPVYFRSLISLLSSAVPFAGALLGLEALRRRQHSVLPLGRIPNYLFFLTWVVLSIIPYSFLTYSKYIPSRNTYWPSIGLAALIGVIFSALYNRVPSRRARGICVFMLAAVLGFNVAYLWKKQDPRYIKRSAPTYQLILLLNDPELSARKPPISICDFPLHPSIGKEAVVHFTSFKTEDVEFTNRCEDGNAVTMKWDETRGRYQILLAESVNRIDARD